MRFRLGLAIGFGAGYVLGSKAGRQRYEQIRSTSAKVWDSEAGRRLRETANRAVDEVSSRALGMLRNYTSGSPELIDLTSDAQDEILRH